VVAVAALSLIRTARHWDSEGTRARVVTTVAYG
jgi:hypothetical protein